MLYYSIHHQQDMLRPTKNTCVSANMPKELGSVGRKIFLFCV